MKQIDHNKPILFFVVLVLVFYFNHVLPFGVTITLLLSPFFVLSIIKWKRFNVLLYGAVGLFIINIPHLLLGVDLNAWLISNVNIFSVFLFTSVGIILAKSDTIKTNDVKRISLLNAICLCIALLLYFIPSLRSILWYEIPFTPNHDVIPRLKMFTLEASHYSLLIVPLFLYYFLQFLKHISLKEGILFLTLGLSLVCSFSLGVLFVLGLSTLGLVMFYTRSFFSLSHSRTLILIAIIGFSLSMFGLYVYYPDNPLFFRIENVLTGVDTSGRGRTYEAFDIAWKVLEENNTWFGVGIGQFKLVGRETLINYYKYMNIPDVVRLPNVMAETLVTFGVFGFVSKLMLQIVLFFKTRVYQNIYQCSIFLFVFIYQFTGSYLVNTTEYILWILAFVPVFPFYSIKNYFKL